jgi:hypothetical protein
MVSAKNNASFSFVGRRQNQRKQSVIFLCWPMTKFEESHKSAKKYLPILTII